MKRATFIVSVGLLALALQPARALAWGNEGHRIVCQIAFERLTPKAKALVTAIFADRPSVNDPFAGCTSCGDHKDDGRFRSWRSLPVHERGGRFFVQSHPPKRGRMEYRSVWKEWRRHENAEVHG